MESSIYYDLCVAFDNHISRNINSNKMSLIKKVILKCGDREVKVSKTIADLHGVSDNQEVSETKMQEVVTSNATHVLNIVKAKAPGRVN